MTTYPRSAYKDPWKGKGVPNTPASARGWGSGWPTCQPGKMATVVAKDQTRGESYDIRVTVRREIAELVANLLEATDRLYDLSVSHTGGYNCRPIAGTNTASNHSWGLALDLNWNDNPYSSTFHSEIPPAVVDMWVACGFGWGGFYRHRFDTMHFEYLGKPSNVAAHLKKAKAFNAGKTPAPAKPTTKPQAVDPTDFPDGLKPGDHNPAVENLQRWLIAAHCGPIDGAVTDYYGPNTQRAVMRFHSKYPQFAEGLRDPAIGPKGWAFLRGIVGGR